MRRNQVSITINRLGDQSPNGRRQIIEIYADANNIYEALCAAYYEALDAVQAYDNPLPSFGRRSSSDDIPESEQRKPKWDGRDVHLREYSNGVTAKPLTCKFGGQHPFSNYHPAPATYEGITFVNGEAAFQSAKTLDIEARKAFASISPRDAKDKGRRLALRPDWEEVKYQVMCDVLRSKFQNPELKQQLLDTGNLNLVEDTTGWHDNEWGDCSCEKCRSIPGKNLLGKALMELREESRR